MVISKRPVLSDSGVPVAHIETWTITGMLLASSSSLLDDAIAEMIEAYSVDRQDIALLFTDESDTQHTIENSSTKGGVRIIDGPNFPNGKANEYVNKREYNLTIEAEIPVTQPLTGVVSFTETLTTFGGGPRVAVIERAIGLPIAQTTRRATIYEAIQSGSATGYSGLPAIPGPLFPNAQYDNPRISVVSPKRRGLSFTHYQVSWEYRFRSAFPLSGTPNS